MLLLSCSRASSRPALLALSRHHERAADRFGLDLTARQRRRRDAPSWRCRSRTWPCRARAASTSCFAPATRPSGSGSTSSTAIAARPSARLLAARLDVEPLDRADAGIAEDAVPGRHGAGVQPDAAVPTSMVLVVALQLLTREAAAASVGRPVAGEVDRRDLLTGRAGQRQSRVLVRRRADDDVRARDA